MILKSFLLGNPVSLCMNIINLVVMVGLYYGFLTTFSIGPSYLFLLRARVLEEGEEGTEKKVSATTGFIAGQLMMFISIYYAPLHLALGRPHTITVIALSYLLFHFFWNNHKHFFDYGSTTRNSMRNLSIQCVFLNNLIFQLFNHFILPSSMLARLVNIYMFRCNNKMLFVTSSFVGWLIGHIFFFMKWVELVLEQEGSTKEDPSLFSEEKEDPDKIDEREEIRVNEKEKTRDEFKFQETFYKDSQVYKTSYMDSNKNKENSKLEIFKLKEDPFFFFFLWFEKPLVTLLFDYKQWNRPLRYIKNNHFENAVRNEVSQYIFLYTSKQWKRKNIFYVSPQFVEAIKGKKEMEGGGKGEAAEVMP
ncbi:hypothetical protein ACJRO7_034294 [Eucalyptus globulus]|uniref:Translocon at the inner envelope membrane of chloroplasts 214 n=1 Tax=Eucalyptus globulus TaxID=34317 RepID=A0ABD3J2M6_EUCGL